MSKEIDYKDDDGYMVRVLTFREDSSPSSGIPLSLYVESFGVKPEVQAILFNKGFVTQSDWFKSGIYEALTSACQRVEKLGRDQCKIKARDIIQRVREDYRS